MEFLTADWQTLFGLIAVFAVAVERSTAVFLNVVDIDSKIENPKVSNAVKQTIACMFGMLIYLTSSKKIPFIDSYFHPFAASLVVGLLASGGSGFWNSVLKAIPKVGPTPKV